MSPQMENIADIFTKALARPIFEKFQGMLGLCYICLRSVEVITNILHPGKVFLSFTFYSIFLIQASYNKCH